MAGILLASDLSPHIDRALDRAVLMAGGRDGGLHVVHVVGTELMSGPERAAATASAEAVLRDDLAEAGLPAGLAVTPLVCTGEPGPAIVQAAHAAGSSLVVMAAPHADLLVRIFRASVPNHVVRHAPCPVLVVRRRARQHYRRIVVAVDFSLPSRRALELALRLLPGPAMAQAELTVVHAGFAGGPPGAAREQQARLDDMLAASLARLAAEGRTAPARTASEIAPGDAVPVLAAAVAARRAELVVVGTMGLTGAANLLLGSTAEALLATLPCDVLAVRPAES